MVPRSQETSGIRRPPRRGRPAGFTLAELLTVVAVVALLMGLLLPSVQSARAQARSVVCLSNLRQMSVAAQVYVEAGSGRYPVAYWFDLRDPVRPVALNWDYKTTIDWPAGGTVSIESGLLWGGQAADRIQQCPAFGGPSNAVAANTSEPHTGYNYNTSFIGHGQAETIPDPATAVSVRRPSACALFGDGEFRGGANKFMRAPWPNPGDVGFMGRFAGTQGYRHRGRTHVAFCDGHATGWEERHTATSPPDQQHLAPQTGFLSADNAAYDLE